MERKWMTLNQHGKFCLKAYVTAISGLDITESQLDYLHARGLTDYASKLPDAKKRCPVAMEALTDLGTETAKHYFPNCI